MAAIPLMIEPVFGFLDQHGKSLAIRLGKLAVAGLWLLFLPNAFYILTDFMHLNGRVLVNARDEAHTYAAFYARGDGLYIYDTLLLFAATAFGAYVGGLALLHAYRYLKKAVSPGLTYMAMAAIMLLCAVGIYIGRFARWNSWDAIIYPYNVLADVSNQLMMEGVRGRFAVVIATMLIFQTASLLYVAYQKKGSKS